MVATLEPGDSEYHDILTFSPLFIGAMVATLHGLLQVVHFPPFSPLFIGAMVATAMEIPSGGFRCIFQSPFHRGNGCYFTMACGDDSDIDLSVPFSSGQWLLLRI